MISFSIISSMYRLKFGIAGNTNTDFKWTRGRKPRRSSSFSQTNDSASSSKDRWHLLEPMKPVADYATEIGRLSRPARAPRGEL